MQGLQQCPHQADLLQPTHNPSRRFSLGLLLRLFSGLHPAWL